MTEINQIQMDLIAKEFISHGKKQNCLIDLCIDPKKRAKAIIVTEKSSIISGIDLIKSIFLKIDPSLVITCFAIDGSFFEAGQPLMSICGKVKSILYGEQAAYFFLSRMSGISNYTKKLSRAISECEITLLENYRAAYNWKIFEKAAFLCGGGKHRRFFCSNGITINENQIQASGGVFSAINTLNETLTGTIKISLITKSLLLAKLGAKCGVHLLILENLSISELYAAKKAIGDRCLIEASGSIDYKKILEIKKTGVDFISSDCILSKASIVPVKMTLDRD
ncbi:MAG: hypothetical protein CMP11_01670 [Zetaproteobacteria bacterium]|nr:hypothetical protein [Pseudobdellovibrionaceae bacterium]